MNGSVKDASFWRSRAEKTRAKAENYYLESEKERLLKIAYEYDQMAIRAEQLQAASER
jgi:hypothetical protein